MVKATLSKIQDDMEFLSRLNQPSYTNLVEQMRNVMEPICIQEEAIRVLTSSPSFAFINEIIGIGQQKQEFINQVRTKDIIFDNLVKVHHSWLKDIMPHHCSIATQLEATAKLSLCNVSYQLAAAERIFSGIDLESLQMRFHKEVVDIGHDVSNLMTSYGSLADSMKSLPKIIQQPSFIIPGATRELLTTGYVLESLNPLKKSNDRDDDSDISIISEIEQETSNCIDLLQQVNLSLVLPYEGARDALYGNNPDRSRHILSSLRELWNHLLRQLAPDDRVIQWIQEHGYQGYLENGRPTRRSKVLYICRNLNNDPLTKFIDVDTRALVKLMEFFNQVHNLNIELTDKQLRAIILKSDSWLMYILQIWMVS